MEYLNSNLTMARFSILILGAFTAIAVLSAPAKAQSTNVSALQSDLQNAICLNDWNQAIQLTGQLMGSSEITSNYRQQLLTFRHQLEGYRADSAQMDNSNNPECAAAIAAAVKPVPVSAQRPPLDWDRAIASVSSSRNSGSSTGVRSQSAQSPDDVFWSHYLNDASSEEIAYANAGPDSMISIAHSACDVLAAGAGRDGVVSMYGGSIPADVFANIVVSGVSAYCPSYLSQI